MNHQRSRKLKALPNAASDSVPGLKGQYAGPRATRGAPRPNMPVPTSVVWASEVIGFISFAITLLTVLGVYRDLISTLRYAPGQIPIMLGNLRQEIATERLVLRRRCREGDEFEVFVSKRRRSRRRTGEVMHLLMQTTEKLWLDFKELERPFLIRSGSRAEAVRKGDYWGDSDVDEKARPPGTPRRGGEKTRRANATAGVEEANIGIDENYYRTDLTHRFIWWQSKSDVLSLADQVQRVQIRRIERDVYECDELVKRMLRKMDGGRDGGASGSGSGSDDGRGPRSGGGVSRKGSRRSVGAANTTYESRETEFVKVPARSRAGSVSRARSISPPRRRSPRLRDRTAESAVPSPVEQRPSNTARRRAARDSRVSTTGGGASEYDVVRPIRDVTYVDLNRPRSRPGLRESQGQSYYRERSETRDPRRSSGGRDGERDRSRPRYDDE